MGALGDLQGLSVEAHSGKITELIVETARSKSSMRLRVPASLVAEWGNGGIYLRCTTEELKLLSENISLMMEMRE